MARHETAPPATTPPIEGDNDSRRPTPQTDPTNSVTQESVGKWVAAEQDSDQGDYQADQRPRE